MPSAELLSEPKLKLLYLLLCQKFLFPPLLDSLSGVCIFSFALHCLAVLGRDPLTVLGDPARVKDGHHPQTIVAVVDVVVLFETHAAAPETDSTLLPHNSASTY